ncbi:hypothetical protein AC249_AIPGENE15996 [Exaiptasia diaphana]|nr:hypothetical protein AC249_AIPGENE15996 [Exaiptasia diaphana]
MNRLLKPEHNIDNATPGYHKPESVLVRCLMAAFSIASQVLLHCVGISSFGLAYVVTKILIWTFSPPENHEA